MDDSAPTSQLPVVVVGAGPTGLAAAVLLALRGVPVLVLDRWTEPYPQPRAVHLDDEACRVLDRLGVGGQFAEISRPALGLRLLDPDLRVLAEFARSADAGVHGHPQANLFDQPGLERVLRERAAQLPLVTVRGGAGVIGLRAGDRWVDVDVRDTGTGGRQVVRAAVVLGCDGANSTVRQAMGSRMEDLRFAQRWLVLDMETDADLRQWDGVQQVCDPHRAATYMRVGERRHRWEFQLLPGEDDRPPDDVLRRLVAPWTRGVPPSDLRLVRVAAYTFRAQVADRWRAGRVLLLGDAAHLSPPFIGQGLGAGLRDADNLAWKVAAVLSGDLPDAALDSYEDERRPQARSVIRLAVLVGAAMTGGGAVGQALRTLVLPRARLVPGLRRRVLESVTPPLRRSALLSRRERGRSLVGTTAPGAPLPDGRRLEDVSRGYLLLSTAPLAPAQSALLHARRGALVPAEGALAAWLRRADVTAAVVRPDGVVAAAGQDVDVLLQRVLPLT